MITRSTGKSENILLESVSVEQDFIDKTFQDFQICCVIFDELLHSNKKIRSLYTR